MIQENFIKIYEKSFQENWDLPALTDYGKETSFTFGQMAEEIARIHRAFGSACTYNIMNFIDEQNDSALGFFNFV